MDFDAVVIGSGPNGLTAAIELARAGCSVAVFERRETVGGGVRTEELTLPGYFHDVCSAIHPLGIGSPSFRALSLEELGVEWIHPDFPVAHPLHDGAVILHRSVRQTAADLGVDGASYARIFDTLSLNADALLEDILAPPHVPKHPFVLSSFGRKAMRSAVSLARSSFSDEPARALFAGIAAHSILPLDRVPSAAFGLVLGILAHHVGWPWPRGGSQRISDALA
jgi:phytoene dehydrogenase-like protein